MSALKASEEKMLEDGCYAINAMTNHTFAAFLNNPTNFHNRATLEQLGRMTARAQMLVNYLNSLKHQKEAVKLNKLKKLRWVHFHSTGEAYALSEDKTTILGKLSDEGYDNCYEISAPTQAFLDTINTVFGTCFRLEEFPGR